METLIMEAVWYLETLGNTNSPVPHNIQKEFIPLKHHCDNLRSCTEIEILEDTLAWTHIECNLFRTHFSFNKSSADSFELFTEF